MKFLVIFGVFVAFVAENSAGRVGRIFNGRDALVGEAPYMIQFRQTRVGETIAEHFCGGALVNPRSIVSAAHCFARNWQGTFTFIATAGQHNWREESPDEQTRDVATIVIHPSFDISVHAISPFDISVVQVESDFVLNNLVAVIALPPTNFIHVGGVQAFGWGSIVPTPPPILADILQTVDMDIISYDLCREVLDVLFPIWNPLHFTDMCTGPLNGINGVCMQDSGGPIVQTNPSTGGMELVGVTAWGASPCNRVSMPSVYARVSAFIDFINQNVN